MVSHCANPACSVPLRYLRDGRLFQFEVRSIPTDGTQQAKTPRQVSRFWLCGQCATNLTLAFDQLKGVKTIPLPVRVERPVTSPFAVPDGSPRPSQGPD